MLSEPKPADDRRYVNVKNRETKKKEQLTPPPRPDKSSVSYSPQLPSRTTSVAYVPGQDVGASKSSVSRTVTRQATFTGTTAWQTRQQDTTNLDRTIRHSNSVEVMPVSGNAQTLPNGYRNGGIHNGGANDIRADPDADRYGYIPMARPDEGIDDEVRVFKLLLSHCALARSSCRCASLKWNTSNLIAQTGSGLVQFALPYGQLWMLTV